MIAKRSGKSRRFAMLLEEINNLEEASLEEICDELSRTSTCIVVDRDDFKRSIRSLYLTRRGIGFTVDDARGIEFPFRIRPRHFVYESLECARECETLEEFADAARSLAKLLNQAADEAIRKV